MSEAKLPEQLTTAEVMAMVKAMSQEERAELDALLLAGDPPLWVPQEGPQRMAYESKADIVFYGGAAGGGKTDLLLGVPLTTQKHSIIFRREAVQLIGIEERMTKILGTRKGYNSQDGVWRLPGGRILELGSVKEPGDWVKYQGRAHDAKCVGRGTLVKMANGGYKAIELVVVGDCVATLEGARKVTRTFVMKKPAALAKAVLNGEVIAQQVQSRSHRLLSPSGWAALCTTPDRAASSPTPRHCACKSAESSSQTFERSSAVPQARYSDRVQPQAPSQGHAGCQSQSGSCAVADTSNLGSGFAAFAYRLSIAALRFSGSVLQELAQPFHAKSVQGSALPSPAHGGSGVPSASSLGGSQGNCLSDPRHGGGQPPRAQAGGLACLLLSGDVAQQTPRRSAGDGQGKTPTHTRRVEWYFHPYTWEKRQIQAEFLEASLEFQEVGEQELFDITVDGANHYITAGGLVNRNCFDEITHFTELQFRTLIGWLRSADPTVRLRVICAGNPPTDAAGEWVKRYWAPWLEPSHPNPAKPGELRWYVTNEKGEDQEVPGPDPVMVGGELMEPKSRTFIPSSVDDNLFLLSTGYKAILMALPEPLRSQMLRGDFQAGASDPAWQVIPTEWVKAAQARWAAREAKGPMTAIGFDPARGGIDKSCIARRHGTWFDELISAPGAVTKDGPSAAAFVVPHVRNGACICVDSIGIGSSALDFIKGLNLLVYPVNGSESSTAVTKAGELRFRNRRAEMYWLLREALDPTAPEPIALPPDPELLGDLTALRYKVVTMGKATALQMLSKDEVRETLGRSPDKGDAIAMTFVTGIPLPESQRQSYQEQPPPDWR